MPSRSKILDLQFPLAGLDRRNSYRRQAPYATPDCLNVRPYDTDLDRRRGGSRPGMNKAYDEQISGASNPVRMLNQVTIVENDGFREWSDFFDGNSLSDAWNIATWYGNRLPSVLSGDFASVDTTYDQVGAIRDAHDPTIDTTSAYQIAAYLVPYQGSYAGKYVLFAKMDDTTPDATTDGIIAEIVMEDDTEAWTGTLYVYDSDGTDTTYTFTAGTGTGAAKPGWFKMLIDGTSVKIYWRGTEVESQTVPAAVGQRWGFGMECTQDGGVCQMDAVELRYFVDEIEDKARTLAVAVANGELWRENAYGQMEELTTDLSLGDRELQSVELGQKLYIADYGDIAAEGTDGVIDADGKLTAASVADWTALGLNTNDFLVEVSNGTGNVTDQVCEISAIIAGSITLDPDPGDGNCTYEIQRGPKVFDPAADTLALLTADSGKGDVPLGADVITVFKDCLVLCRERVWYMSRQGDVNDWDTSETDSQAAVAATNSEAGQVGGRILSAHSFHDAYLIFGCTASTWLMRGHPAFGGQLGAVSLVAGTIGKHAAEVTPDGQYVFLSHDGLYRQPLSTQMMSEPLSKKKIPQDLQNLQSDDRVTSLLYDPDRDGMHVLVSSESGADVYHYWLDMEYLGLFPETFPANYQPYCSCFFKGQNPAHNKVLVGCKDGYIRTFEDAAETDEGTEIDSYVFIGPFRVGNSLYHEGILKSLDAALSEDSGSVDWSVQVGNTNENAARNSATTSGTWATTGGMQYTSYPRARGGSAVVKLANSTTRKWALEGITAVVERIGKQRII